MTPEAWIIAIVALISLLPLTLIARRSWAMGIAVPVVCAVVAAGVWAIGRRGLQPASAAAIPSEDNRPIAVSSDDFVSSKTCRACHPREYTTWHASYHRTMTQLATPESVVGDFDDASYILEGHEYRFFRKNGRPHLHVPAGAAEAGLAGDHEIVMTTGSHHMQVYWFPTARKLTASDSPSREIARSPLAFLFEENRWVPFDATFLRPPGSLKNLLPGEWNRVCISCHSTNGQPGFKFAKKGSLRNSDLYAMDSRVAEFGIACESCHGPSAGHVQQARNPFTRYRLHSGEGVHGDTVHPLKLLGYLSAQVCGQCHSIPLARGQRETIALFNTGAKYRPGDDLFDPKQSHRIIVQTDLQHPGLEFALEQESNYLTSRFWSDGMVRVTGREYHGLLKTPCYSHLDESRGVMTCMSCHQMHPSADDPRSLREWADDQLKAGMRGDLACTQCHETMTNRNKIVAHTNHAFDSAGSKCYNCHMPYTTYGLLKAVRSHTVSSPSVQESLQTGRPNACNQCHLDRTLEWTADQLDNWYGIAPPEADEWLDDELEVAASVLWAVRGDAGQRALMAWSFGWDDARKASSAIDGDWMIPYLALLMDDPYDAVRYIAYHALLKRDAYANMNYDFVAKTDRDTVVQRLEQLRHDMGVSDANKNQPHLLLDTKGNIDAARHRRLLRQRDTRAVILNE